MMACYSVELRFYLLAINKILTLIIGFFLFRLKPIVNFAYDLTNMLLMILFFPSIQAFSHIVISINLFIFIVFPLVLIILNLWLSTPIFKLFFT